MMCSPPPMDVIRSASFVGGLSGYECIMNTHLDIFIYLVGPGTQKDSIFDTFSTPLLLLLLLLLRTPIADRRSLIRRLQSDDMRDPAGPQVQCHWQEGREREVQGRGRPARRHHALAPQRRVLGTAT